MKKYLLPLLLLTAPLLANENNTTLPNTWKISAGAYLVGDFSTDLDFVSHEGYSLGLNVQELFNMKSDVATAYFDSYYRFTPKHRIELGYMGVRTSGSSNSDLQFDGVVDVNITAGAKSSFDTSRIKLAYVYSFYHTEEMEVGLAVGLHYTMFDVGFQADIQNDKGRKLVDSRLRFALSQAIPMIGARFEYHILPRWSVLTAFDIFSLSAGLELTASDNSDLTQEELDKITGFSGYMSNFDLSTEYRIVDNFSLGATFNYQIQDFSMELEDTYDIGVDSTILGLALYGSLHF